MPRSRRSVQKRFLGLAVALLATACGSPEKIMPEGGGPPVEALGLDGAALMRPAVDAEFSQEQNQELLNLQPAVGAGDVEALIWYGRRLGYLGRYRDAIDHYTAALDRHPEDARLWRHRGHRYLTVRRLGLAVEDLQRAAELIEGQADSVEPDGLPNARNEPRSTLGTNVFYHLGLAHYLRGEWGAAVDAYRRCLELSKNDDMRVATSYWLVLALHRRAPQGGDAADGDLEEAQALLAEIHPDLDVIENHDYQRLMLAFKGELELDRVVAEARAAGAQSAATVGYGAGAWRLVTGEASVAGALWRDVTAGPAWPAFGHLAAEAELAASGADSATALPAR
ncbi:MAG: tetratricopeptide repeat protein [Acidobacteriota bacterium]